MKEFVMLFRMAADESFQPSPQEMQAMMKQWENWIGGIAAQGKLAEGGKRLGTEAKTVKAGNVVVNGPYAEIKEMITGFIAVNCASLDEAVELAKGCPILQGGGNVEVKNAIGMND